MCEKNAVEVHVALASNDRYFDGLLVTAVSMARYAAANAIVVFHILDEDITDEHYSFLQACIIREHRKSKIERHRVTRDCMPNLPEFHGSWLPCARLILPDLLPKVERVIYSDVDFLWFADVAELWHLCQDDHVLYSTRDGFGPTEASERHWFKANGLVFPEGRYFCTGLCVFNLAKFRDENLARKVFDFIIRHRDAGFPDQAALNALLNDRTKLLDKKWQQTPRIMAPEDFHFPIVFHYAGEAPWKSTHSTRMVTDTQLLWYVVYASIYSETVWSAMCRHYSTAMIVAYRLMFLLIMVCPVTAFMFNVLMHIMHRGPFRERIRNFPFFPFNLNSAFNLKRAVKNTVACGRGIG